MIINNFNNVIIVVMVYFLYRGGTSVLGLGDGWLGGRWRLSEYRKEVSLKSWDYWVSFDQV